MNTIDALFDQTSYIIVLQALIFVVFYVVPLSLQAYADNPS